MEPTTRSATSDMAAKATRRITSAEFGEWHYRQILYWAFTDKKQSKGTLLRDIGAARAEDINNREVLFKKLEEYALLYKLSIEELQERIQEADKSGTSIRELHRQLANAAGVDAPPDEPEE